MQEDQKPPSEANHASKTGVALAISLAIFAGLCLVVLALTIATSDSPSLPTAVARLAENSPVEVVAGEETIDVTSTPTSAPMVPQRGERSAGDPYAPTLGNTGYDVQQYLLQLALDPAVAHLDGIVTIEAISTIHGLSEITLDFVGFEVSAVTVDGLAAAFQREDGKVVVQLPELKPEKAPFRLVVTYRGAPAVEPSPYLRQIDHLGLHFTEDRMVFVVSEPDGARYWFPANDQLRDKASFRFEIVVPSDLTAVANGQLLETRPGILPSGEAGTLFIWDHPYPMAPYLAVVAVGPYERLEDRSPSGVPIRHYVLPDMREEVLEATSEIGQALNWMEATFGPYPFEAFGFVTAPVTGRSMESQTMVLLAHDLIGKRTAVHELAHMWFGDWVGLNSWAEMWRKEGLATYIQLMWETQGDPEELALQMATVQSVVEGNDKSYPLNNPPPEYLFELNVYYQGAWIFHALRQEIGDKAFFAGLRAYVAKYGGSTASDDDFQRVMEEASGRSLEAFFQQYFPPG